MSKGATLRVLLAPTTFTLFDFQQSQNTYITLQIPVHPANADKEHRRLQHVFENSVVYNIGTPSTHLPDIVFIANGGLSLPRIPRTILLPSMKYKQRRDELPYLKQIYTDLGLTMIPFTGAPFEGQAELKWFHGGTKAICGYGFRATRKAFTLLDKLFTKLYGSYGLAPPTLLVIPLESKDYYHLDVAMLEVDDTKCIVHRRAFSPASIAKMKAFLGDKNVHVLDTKDTFCLNAVIDGDTLVTHSLAGDGLRERLEELSGKHVRQVCTSEFEKSGGSVRCMTLDVYDF